MSERCLDRKSVQEVVLPVEPTRTTEESEEIPAPAAPVAPTAPPTVSETFPFEQQQPTTATTSGPKCEQRGREALWDLFQSECAFLYDHLMVLKNVTFSKLFLLLLLL